MDTGTGSRSDARMASALGRCAVLLRLVTHARTPARWRSAQTTTGRRMARGVHCHGSLRKLGGGHRRRLRRRLNAWASMPLTYGPTDLRLRLDSFGRGTDGRRKTLRRPVNSGDPGIASCDRSATRRTSHVCLQVAADWAASKHLGGSRNLVKAGPLADPATRPQGRRQLDPRVWRISGPRPVLRVCPAFVTPRVFHRALAGDRKRGFSIVRRSESRRVKASVASRQLFCLLPRRRGVCGPLGEIESIRVVERWWLRCDDRS